MRFPILVISYGNFVETNKLFFYESGGVGCMPMFTDPMMASLFVPSLYSVMGEMLADKPRLYIMTCAERQHALDMLEYCMTMAGNMQYVEMDPLPLTEEYKQKVRLAGSDRQYYKYELSELIEILRRDIDQSKTP